MHEVEESLRLWGASLFAGSLVMCFVEIILSSANVGVMKLPRMNLAMPGAASSPLTAALAHLGPAVPFFFSGTLPALGAAFLGIRHVGEFSRLERRSFAMAAALGGAQRSLNLARKAGGKRKTLAPQLEMIALQMMSETAEWRTLVIAHHLEYS
jgi:hypothetical protein